MLLELGQPLHAFDLGRLQRGIVVRMAHTGERLSCWTAAKSPWMKKPSPSPTVPEPSPWPASWAASAPAVTSATRDIFLECAYFAPLAIGGTARRYGLQTDASQRYERGVDHALQAAAIERATRLLLDVAGRRRGPGVEAKSATQLPRPAQVTLRRRRLDALVGEAIPEGEVDRIFERLEFSPRKVGAGESLAWQIMPPSHRFDIAIEEDLVEEVCRVYGYNRIGRGPRHGPCRCGKCPGVGAGGRVGRCAGRARLSEAITYTFVDPTLADLLDPYKVAPQLANPMSQDRSVCGRASCRGWWAPCRPTWPGQQSRVRLFEMGQCFAAAKPMTRSAGCRSGWAASRSARAGRNLGRRRLRKGWIFFDVKGDVERLIEIGGHPASFEAADDPALHPGQSAQVLMAGKAIGRVAPAPGSGAETATQCAGLRV